MSSLAQKLWEECRQADDFTMTHEELLAVTDEKESICKKAINMLLTKNLFILLTDSKGKVSYRGVSREDAHLKGDLSAEEHLVYGHIAAAKNQGIWTKTLKLRTNLHQTVLNRCLKKLESQNYVKTIKSVEYPTRKIYMLKDLEPSVNISGGPWYTDHELDTAFIESHSEAILVYVRSRSFPEPTDDCSEMLYPTSMTKNYPSATQITGWLKKAQISPTELEEEHVQMLLNMLIYSGEIESLPSTGLSSLAFELDDRSAGNGDSDTESSGGGDRRSKKSKAKSKSKTKGRKRSRRSDSDSNSDSESQLKPAKRHKSKKADSGSDSDSDDDASRSTRGKKRKKRSATSDSDSEDARSAKRSKKSKPLFNDVEDDSDTASDSSSTSKSKQKRAKSSKSSSASKKKTSKTNGKRVRSDSPELENIEFDLDFARVDVGGAGSSISSTGGGAGGVVYRALRRERFGLGWSETPCGRCPQFDFCRDKGPVNPEQCKYFGDWLEQPIGTQVEDD